MVFRSLVCLVLSLAVGGCESMLPRGSSDTPTTFETFEQAQAAAERIVAFETRTSGLKDLGFDPAGANVTLIPYPEIVGRLAPHPGVPIDLLDPGIRKCIYAQSGCRAYRFRFEREDRRREGGFWLDFLNIRRVTVVRAWWFEALVVVSGGEVLFRNTGGQPHVDKVEKQTNPLGPLQRAGESAGGFLFN